MMADPSRNLQGDWAPDAAIYHVVALGLELALLVAVAAWSYLTVTGATGIVAAGASVALMALLWGVFAAPKSESRLKGLALLAFKVAAFATGALAFWGNGWILAAEVYAVIALLSLAFVWWRGVL